MSWVSQKEKFTNIKDYINFAKVYLEFISSELQAEIVAKNENNYKFKYVVEETNKYLIKLNKGETLYIK